MSSVEAGRKRRVAAFREAKELLMFLDVGVDDLIVLAAYLDEGDTSVMLAQRAAVMSAYHAGSPDAATWKPDS